MHTLPDEVGFPDERGQLVLPRLMRTSYSRMEPHGAYGRREWKYLARIQLVETVDIVQVAQQLRRHGLSKPGRIPG
jgi:hypothetical protein